MNDVAPLDPGLCREHVRRALAEDLGWGDVTTDALVPGTTRARGRIVSLAPATLAGIALAEEAFRQLDPVATFDQRVPDGTVIGAGQVVLDVHGAAGALLTAERTARNFLARLTGIATATARCVALARGCVVRTSRDTTPGLRALEHYAARVGGGAPYRAALDAGLIATTNHVQFTSGLATAVRCVIALQNDLPTTVEVRSLDEVDTALDAGARRLIFGAAWGPSLAAGVARVAGRALVDVIVADADAVASLDAATLQHVACVVVARMPCTGTPPAFTFIAEPDLAGGTSRG